MAYGGTANDWLHRITNARSGQVALFVYSFLEATMLPVPVEAVMAPYMQMRRDILWRLAAIALAGFMASALLGYGFGALLFDEIGAPLVKKLGWEDQFASVQNRLAGGGFLAIFLIALTPMPTQIAMIGAGLLGVPLAVFVPAVTAARGLRYFGVALLVWRYGEAVAAWFARRNAGHAETRPRR